MEIAFDCFFALDASFWGHKGVPPHQMHPQIPWITGTGMPNLDPFFTSSFNCNFQTNDDNQTFIVYAKSTLVVFRKSLCVFSVLGFALEEKLCGAKCSRFYEPEEVTIRHFSYLNTTTRHSLI